MEQLPHHGRKRAAELDANRPARKLLSSTILRALGGLVFLGLSATAMLGLAIWHVVTLCADARAASSRLVGVASGQEVAHPGTEEGVLGLARKCEESLADSNVVPARASEAERGGSTAVFDMECRRLSGNASSLPGATVSILEGALAGSASAGKDSGVIRAFILVDQSSDQILYAYPAVEFGSDFSLAERPWFITLRELANDRVACTPAYYDYQLGRPVCSVLARWGRVSIGIDVETSSPVGSRPVYLLNTAVCLTTLLYLLRQYRQQRRKATLLMAVSVVGVGASYAKLLMSSVGDSVSWWDVMPTSSCLLVAAYLLPPSARLPNLWMMTLCFIGEMAVGLRAIAANEFEAASWVAMAILMVTALVLGRYFVMAAGDRVAPRGFAVMTGAASVSVFVLGYLQIGLAYPNASLSAILPSAIGGWLRTHELYVLDSPLGVALLLLWAKSTVFLCMAGAIRSVTSYLTYVATAGSREIPWVLVDGSCTIVDASEYLFGHELNGKRFDALLDGAADKEDVKEAILGNGAMTGRYTSSPRLFRGRAFYLRVMPAPESDGMAARFYIEMDIERGARMVAMLVAGVSQRMHPKIVGGDKERDCSPDVLLSRFLSQAAADHALLTRTCSVTEAVEIWRDALARQGAAYMTSRGAFELLELLGTRCYIALPKPVWQICVCDIMRALAGCIEGAPLHASSEVKHGVLEVAVSWSCNDGLRALAARGPTARDLLEAFSAAVRVEVRKRDRFLVIGWPLVTGVVGRPGK